MIVVTNLTCEIFVVTCCDTSVSVLKNLTLIILQNPQDAAGILV